MRWVLSGSKPLVRPKWKEEKHLAAQTRPCTWSVRSTRKPRLGKRAMLKIGNPKLAESHVDSGQCSGDNPYTPALPNMGQCRSAWSRCLSRLKATQPTCKNGMHPALPDACQKLTPSPATGARESRSIFPRDAASRLSRCRSWDPAKSRKARVFRHGREDTSIDGSCNATTWTRFCHNRSTRNFRISTTAVHWTVALRTIQRLAGWGKPPKTWDFAPLEPAGGK